MRKLALILGVVALFTISACSSAGVATNPVEEPNPTIVEEEPAPETETPANEEPVAEEPTDSPEPTLTTFKAGEKITITNDDEPWADVVISRVKQVKRYNGEFGDDKPAKGNIYIQAFVTYNALTDGVDYNPFDWQVFVNDEAVENYASVLNGPKPDLNSGTLPKGRKASGYVVYEVPVRGRVIMSYGGNAFSNEAPIFEVVLRSK